MPDRVLYQRLQQKTRHQRLLRLGIDSEGDHEARTEANLLQGQIFLRHRNLFFQRNLVCVRRLQGSAQQVRQTSDHLRGNPRLVVQHQSRDRIQNVEEKVRLKLVAQGTHLCLARHHLQSLHPSLLFFPSLVVLDAKVEKAPSRQDKATACGVDEDIAPVEGRGSTAEVALRPQRCRGTQDAQSICDNRTSEQCSNKRDASLPQRMAHSVHQETGGKSR